MFYIQESRDRAGLGHRGEYGHEHAVSSPWARPGPLAFAQQIISLDRS
jgi:hypothetical protein